jgi:hypothetical protein
MKNINIKSKIIHTVWSSIDTINKNNLLQLSDTDLIHKIVNHVDKASSLNGEEKQSLIDYVGAKVCLIRDIAES